MAWSYSAGQVPARVVEYGGARVEDLAYKGDGSTTFAKGDLIRVNTSGQVVDAGTDTDTTGPCHGMVLDDWTTAPTTSQSVPVLMFASDTVIETQIYDATAADAEPQDVNIGSSYTLRNDSAGIWSMTTTTTKGICKVVAKTTDSKWFEEDADTDYGLVRWSLTQANLDAHGS